MHPTNLGGHKLLCLREAYPPSLKASRCPLDHLYDPGSELPATGEVIRLSAKRNEVHAAFCAVVDAVACLRIVMLSKIARTLRERGERLLTIGSYCVNNILRGEDIDNIQI